MVINKTAKGNRNEKIVRTLFENNGYTIDFKYKQRFSKNQDIFGYWDFIGIKNSDIIFVQVKSNATDVSKFKRTSLEYFNNHKPCKNINYYIYHVINKNNIRIYQYKNKWEEVL